MFVAQWMSSDVVTTTPETTAREAWRSMVDNRIRRLPVLEGEALVGIVARSDLLSVLGPMATRHPDVHVGEIMTPDPITVGPMTTIEKAALIMHDAKIASIPIVAEGRLRGIITETDIFRAVIQIMAINANAARLEYQFKTNESLLELLSDRVRGLSLQSLVTFRDETRDRWIAVLRVRGQEAPTAPAESSGRSGALPV